MLRPVTCVLFCQVLIVRPVLNLYARFSLSVIMQIKVSFLFEIVSYEFDFGRVDFEFGKKYPSAACSSTVANRVLLLLAQFCCGQPLCHKDGVLFLSRSQGIMNFNMFSLYLKIL